MNKTFKKILSVCCTVVTTLTATLFRSTEVHADNTYKIVFIGESEVGKTQLVTRIARNEFVGNYTSTIGASFFTRTSGKEDRINLFDLAGTERFQIFVQTYYHKAHVLLYCCSTQQLTSQTQNCNIDKYNIPRDSTVLICITQADTMTDDKSDTQTQLGQTLQYFQTNAPQCTILPEILVTSAKTGKYKFCKPEDYDSTTYKNIHPNLAEDLVNLCRGQETAQNTVKSDQRGMCENSGNDSNAGATNNTSLADNDNRSYGKKPKMHLGYWLGIPTSLFGIGLLASLGCYGYDRHKKKKLVKPKAPKIPKEQPPKQAHT